MRIRTSLRTLFVSAACLVSGLLPTAAAAQLPFRANAVRHIERRQDSARVEFATGDVALFAFEGAVVTHIEVNLAGRQYRVPLDCAGGLRNVRVETADIRHDEEDSHALLFQAGSEDEVSGLADLIQIDLLRGAVRDISITRRNLTTRLCPERPARPAWCENRPLGSASLDELVGEVPEFPLSIQAGGNMRPIERRRRQVYEELLVRGPAAVTALEARLQSADAAVRRGAVFTLMVLSGGWWTPYDCGPEKLDLLPILPALVAALEDPDAEVQARAIGAIGHIGPAAAETAPLLLSYMVRPSTGQARAAVIQALGALGPAAADAVPFFIELLDRDDEPLRFVACRALMGIGPAAVAAAPALARTLSDPDDALRRCAAGALEAISGNR